MNQTITEEIKELLLNSLQEKYDEAERRGKEMTARNRSKFARDNETLGESRARTQGFKSGILIAKQVVATLTSSEETHEYGQ